MKNIAVTFNLTNDLVEFLQAQANLEQVPVTTIIRRAIKLEKFLIETEQSNKKVLIEHDGVIHQLSRY